MKALYLYNPHDVKEVSLVERAQAEMGVYVKIMSVEDAPGVIRELIRSTPALITAEDHLQGEGLTSDTVDGSLLVTATLYKRLEQDEANFHQVETHRLDHLINVEKTRAIDDYTLELMDGGLI